MVATGRPLDVAIQGPGYFRVYIDGIGSDTAYTRIGRLVIDDAGRLAVQAGGEHRLCPPIMIPHNTPESAIRIFTDGAIAIEFNGKGPLTTIAQLELFKPLKPSELKPLGNGLYYQDWNADGSRVMEMRGSDSSRFLQHYLQVASVGTEATSRHQSPLPRVSFADALSVRR